LAGAFRRLADTDLARRLGERAYRRYWTAPPDPDAHAGNLLELYGAMLARSPAG
jgi:hypothetical protein